MKYNRKRVTDVSVRIASGLKDLRLSVSDLSMRLDVPEKKVIRYLSGKHNFTLVDMVRIEDVLDMRLILPPYSYEDVKPEDYVQRVYSDNINDINSIMEKAQTIFDNAPRVDLWQQSRNNDIIARFEGVKMMLKGLKKK